jgi:hypothetical protein
MVFMAAQYFFCCVTQLFSCAFRFFCQIALTDSHMSTSRKQRKPKTSSTKVEFDLAAELTAAELASFVASAQAAGVDLTTHFLNLTIRTTKS